MANENRLDPVEILARVGGTLPGIGGSERAFQVLLDKIRKAGWETAESSYRDNPDSTECGSVLIEGIKYVVHYGPRVRRDLIDDSAGELSQRPILGYAAWVEPSLSDYSLE
ncbi:hypothetical protein [Krasilnikovia sp. MM14-A1259]|uniref:hypothetical protein n=1 Tax=Krasilnikovia sp. MM14-A1259 TaxID=3373539 RepID=UPI00399CC914